MKLSEHVRSTHNRDGAVVLDILHGEMYRLNLVGSRMLELLKDGFTNAQIADAISHEFGVARETVTADLEEFLRASGKTQAAQPVRAWEASRLMTNLDAHLNSTRSRSLSRPALPA